ncbi:MAG TPA: hypothetical protein VII69_12750 [Candidatus Eremiobacteraceae bacterium]
MRPLEALLLIITLAALLAFAVRRFRAVRRTRFLPTAALLALSAQVLLEGARWQMATAYAVSVLLFLISLLRQSGPGESVEPGRLRRLGRGLAIGLGAVALALAAFLALTFPVFNFPQPHGPYQIGTLTYDWVDAGRPEIFRADPSDRRELMVQVWYPVQGSKSTKRAPYVNDGYALAPLARLLHLPGFIFQYLKYIKTNAIPGASVAPGTATYPVLVFSHGRGGFRQHNTAQVEELVSHGYIVAAIDHTYAAAGVVFPDGRLASLRRPHARSQVRG